MKKVFRAFIGILILIVFTIILFWFQIYFPKSFSSNKVFTYTAKKGLGGGIILDATHEFDLLFWLLNV